MPKITIKNLANKEIRSLTSDLSVLSVIQENNIEWMHSCGAKGRCTTCKMIVVKGNEYLSSDSKHEISYRSQHQLNENERLACQCIVSGDITILVPPSGQLPHITYTE